MSTRLAPSLQSILYRLVGAGVADARLSPPATASGRFPVVVRPETRTFLEAQARTLGGSMAGIAGAILDGVAATTLERDGGAVSMRGVVERFNLMLQEHGLSTPAAVRVLEPYGFRIVDFSSSDTQLARLDADTISSVAERFRISYDWLAVRSNEPTEVFHRWYKQPEKAAAAIVQAVAASVDAELILLIPDGFDIDSPDNPRAAMPDFTPVLATTATAGPQEVLRIFEVWEEGRWEHQRCREHIKLVVHFMMQLARRRSGIRVSGYSVAKSWYDALSSRTVMASTLFRSAARRSWHPDDYVLTDSHTAKDREEWLSIRRDKQYASTFECFDRLQGQL